VVSHWLRLEKIHRGPTDAKLKPLTWEALAQYEQAVGKRGFPKRQQMTLVLPCRHPEPGVHREESTILVNSSIMTIHQ